VKVTFSEERRLLGLAGCRLLPDSSTFFGHPILSLLSVSKCV
jgi:hypothetical protein